MHSRDVRRKMSCSISTVSSQDMKMLFKMLPRPLPHRKFPLVHNIIEELPGRQNAPSVCSKHSFDIRFTLTFGRLGKEEQHSVARGTGPILSHLTSKCPAYIVAILAEVGVSKRSEEPRYRYRATFTYL